MKLQGAVRRSPFASPKCYYMTEQDGLAGEHANFSRHLCNIVVHRRLCHNLNNVSSYLKYFKLKLVWFQLVIFYKLL